MKRRAFQLVVFLLLSSPAWSQTTTYPEPEFSPLDVAALGSGGESAAETAGMRSLFVNPAGFTASTPSFTLLGLSTALDFTR